MEFEQYLEKDIITFLDSKIEKKDSTNVDREEEYGIYLMRDYLKELSYALDNDELTKAKKLFDELKQNYSRVPKSSLQRKKMYTLLEKMYEKIQNYVKIKEGKIEIIKEGDNEIQKDTTETFPDFTNIAEKNKFDASKATISELANRKVLPIGSDNARPETQTEESNDTEKNISTVESKITGSTIKESKSKGSKYYEDKTEPSEETEDEKSENQNVFVRSKPIVDKVREETEKSLINKRKKRYKDVNGIIDENKTLSKHPEISERKRSIELEDLKDNIIDKTIAHLEILKMHITERLLNELSRKLDESNNEQNKRIEDLRKELVKKMTDELEKRFGSQEHKISHKIEQLREEILDEVYHQAQHIVTSKDNLQNQDEIKYTENAQNQISDEPENVTDKIETPNKKYSNDDLRVVYEQASYYMLDNKYSEAAKLFRKIIDIQPKNKAAKIRLQECIEKQPEISNNQYIAEDSTIKTVMKDTDNSEQGENIGNTYNTNITTLNEEIDDFKNSISEHIDNLTKDFGKEEKIETQTYATQGLNDVVVAGQYGLENPIQNIPPIEQSNIKYTEDEQNKTPEESESITEKRRVSTKKYSNDDLRVVYEQAIYCMFDNRYNEAAKLFRKIIDIQPKNKAAKIRLQECIEKQPEISNNQYIAEDSTIKTITRHAEYSRKEGNTDIELNEETEKIDDFKDNISEHIDNLTKDFGKEEKTETHNTYDLRHKYNDEEVQKMYEEAVYTMFQSNYDEAAKMFQQILRIRPANKAARIRLQECIGAISNA